MKPSLEPEMSQALPSASVGGSQSRGITLRQLQWAASRICFYIYIGLSMISGGILGWLTAPFMSWIFFGDWRAWRYIKSGSGLFAFSYRMVFLMLRGHDYKFLFSVDMTSPPASSVDRRLVKLNPTWEFGNSCGPCSRCCNKHDCPILDLATGMCRGYDSFFWRYFNCGRYPAEQQEVDYYACPKWIVPHSKPQVGHGHTSSQDVQPESAPTKVA